MGEHGGGRLCASWDCPQRGYLIGRVVRGEEGRAGTDRWAEASSKVLGASWEPQGIGKFSRESL